MAGFKFAPRAAIDSFIIGRNRAPSLSLASRALISRPDFEQCLEASRAQKAGVTIMRYLVVVEKGPTSFGAYVPDLPGCIAVGETREEVLASIHEAIEFHLEGLKEDGQPIPPPSSSSEVIEVAA
jgi:predicted RNase H-like HicB family nuclease